MELLSPAQCRAARALLNWSQPDLALRCDMHVQTISLFESENSTPTKRTLEKIGSVLAAAGVEFMPQEGVRKKAPEIKTLRGRGEFQNFFWDVYETLKRTGTEVCVSNVDEATFLKYLDAEGAETYRQKMVALKKDQPFEFKILCREGDKNLICSYGEYRWIEKKFFHKTPFYVYGDKLALIRFEDDVTVYIVENKDIADAQRVQFNYIWEKAQIPKV